MKTKSDSPTPTNPAVNSAFSEIRKQFGEGSVVQLAAAQFPKVETLSTGSLAIDVALGVGGLPRGRIVEIFGPESSGKSSLCLSVMAEAQRNGGLAAFIDCEHGLDFKWARTCGVDVGSLIFSQPGSGEEALTIAERLIASNAIDVVVIDSVAALVPKVELEGAPGDIAVGALGRLMGQAMRRLTAAVSRSRCVFILTNQLRESIGKTYGPVEYTVGGRALKYFSSLRLDVRRKETLKTAEGVATGNRVRLKVVKNKVAPPYTECEFDLGFDCGLCQAGTLLDLGIEHKLLEKKGAWIARNGELIGNGREAAKAYLRANPAVTRELDQALRARLLPSSGEETASAKAA